MKCFKEFDDTSYIIAPDGRGVLSIADIRQLNQVEQYLELNQIKYSYSHINSVDDQLPHKLYFSAETSSRVEKFLPRESLNRLLNDFLERVSHNHFVKNILLPKDIAGILKSAVYAPALKEGEYGELTLPNKTAAKELSAFLNPAFMHYCPDDKKNTLEIIDYKAFEERFGHNVSYPARLQTLVARFSHIQPAKTTALEVC